MDFPLAPEPHTLEVEVTNHCSAKCAFCPHPRMTRQKGFMEVARFETFLKDVAAHRDSLWLNRKAGGPLFPRVVFAGLGEPTMHPDLDQLVARCKEKGFSARVVTNGAHLNRRMVSRLLDAGLASLAISLPTLNADVYRQTMKLDLVNVLPRVRETLALLKNTDLDVQLWRVLPPPGMPRETPADQAAYTALLADFPRVTVLGPSEPWNRDNTVPQSIWQLSSDYPEGNVWCANLFFTCNLAWDGTAVMCCVDYHRVTEPLGNAFELGFAGIQRRRQEIHEATVKPDLCKGCRKWKDSEYNELYHSFLAKRASVVEASGGQLARELQVALWASPPLEKS